MRVNLLWLINQPKLMKSLNNKMQQKEPKRSDEVREFIYHYFPDRVIRYAHYKLISDIGDMLLSLVDEEDFRVSSDSQIKQDLKVFMHNISNLQLHYKDCRKQVNLNYIKNHDSNIVQLIKQNNNELSDDLIEKGLTQLQIYYDYRQYTEGYNYEESQIYLWWIKIIKEALNNRSHNLAPNTRDFLSPF